MNNIVSQVKGAKFTSLLKEKEKNAAKNSGIII